MLDDFNRRACERTTPLLRCCRGLARGLLLCTLPTLPAHLVEIPAVVTHHLKALIRNVLRDRRDEIARAEHLIDRWAARVRHQPSGRENRTCAARCKDNRHRNADCVHCALGAGRSALRIVTRAPVTTTDGGRCARNHNAPARHRRRRRYGGGVTSRASRKPAILRRYSGIRTNREALRQLCE